MGFWSVPFLGLTGALGLTPRADAEYQAITRSPFWVLEIDVTRCTLTHAAAPCAAAAASDGMRCFYSRRTCRDTANYTAGVTTYRFISDSMHYGRAPALYASWSQLWPLLQKVSPLAQQLDTTGGFTLPERMTFHMNEFGDDDPGLTDGTKRIKTLPILDIDKTVRNESRAGQFWRRFVSIHPNYRNFPVRLKRGFATDTFTIYDLHTTWTGKLENIGLETSGGATIKCADEYGSDQAGIEREIPSKVSSGNNVTADAGRASTTINVQDATVLADPAAVDFSVYVRKRGGTGEIMEITARASSTSWTVSRQKFGTLAEPIHKGDILEEIVPYTTADGQGGWHPVDIIADLMLRGGVASDDIDTAQMARGGAFVNGLRLRRIIVEPKSIKSLIGEVCELIGASVHMDTSLRFRLSMMRPQYPGEVS